MLIASRCRHASISPALRCGNTLLPADALAQSVAPFVGAQRDFSDVAKAQEALKTAHRQGYPLVRIDLLEQELNGGVVLDVVQVRIGQVTVAGNQHFSTANVRQSLSALQEGSSPDLAAVSIPARPTKTRLAQADRDEAQDWRGRRYGGRRRASQR